MRLSKLCATILIMSVGGRSFMSNANHTIKKSTSQARDLFSNVKKQYDKIIASNQYNGYALLYMNIKNFDSFNYLGSWEFGTHLIEDINTTISKHLNPNESIAHIFGDHFVLIMQYEKRDELRSRLLKFLKEIYNFEDDLIYHNIFLSFGIYELSFEKVDFYEALVRANITRKESTSIHNRSFCWEYYNSEVMNNYKKRIKLEHSTAMAYKNEEFVPFLQPKVDPKTGQIVGAEALLRLFDEDGKPIPVQSFLPILNQNEYIVLVDLNIFDQVCKLLDRQIKLGLPVVPISFNISKACFYKPSFLKKYTDIFETYDIPKELIQFELMESITLDDTDLLNETIIEIKNAGFTCILDDFGVGYSSFSILLNTNLDEIKIDRQFFVKDINDESRRMIKTVTDLIHSLGMTITAEGIESKEYVDLLIECEVEYIQGFYFYKPLPIEEFFEVLDKTK